MKGEIESGQLRVLTAALLKKWKVISMYSLSPWKRLIGMTEIESVGFPKFSEQATDSSKNL